MNPRPFDPCEDIPLDVINRIGIGFTPPEHEDGLRCHYDAGNYQMTVEAFVWRTYEQTLPADAVELDIGGHRAAQYWIALRAVLAQSSGGSSHGPAAPSRLKP